MKKADAKVPRVATQTAVDNISALNFQSTEADYAREHEDTQEDKAVNEGGAIIPTKHDDSVPSTQLDGFHVQDHQPAEVH